MSIGEMHCDDCGAKIPPGDDIFIDRFNFDVKESLVVCPECYEDKYKDNLQLQEVFSRFRRGQYENWGWRKGE